MKVKLFKVVKACLFMIAVFAAATPSQFGSYQAEIPNKLKKYKI